MVNSLRVLLMPLLPSLSTSILASSLHLGKATRQSPRLASLQPVFLWVSHRSANPLLAPTHSHTVGLLLPLALESVINSC